MGKLAAIWNEPFLNKINRLSNLYYQAKGALLYRFLFRRFGKRSLIRRPILISHPECISIGDHVTIRDGVRLEVVRESSRRTPDLRIGDHTNIEQHVHIVCHSRVHIGANVSITGNSAIVDVTHPFEDVDAAQKIGARIRDDDSFVEIGDGSFIGFGSVIMPNVRLGKYTVIGAHSLVTRSVPDYCVAAGNPAKVVKRYDPVTKAWVKTDQA